MPDKKTFVCPVPQMAPLGVEVTSGMVREAWDAIIKPAQEKGEPQSGEERIQMAIFRAVYEGLLNQEKLD